MANKLKECFGIDLRSLALFRIGLGLLILIDLIQHATSRPFTIVLTLFAGLFALGLLFGYRTRLMALFSWVLLLYLHIQAPGPQGGEVLLRHLLLWAIFLPLGARYSVDSALNSGPPVETKRIVSGASLALRLQILWFYGISFALLSRSSGWMEGVVALFTFLPTWLWERIFTRLRTTERLNAKIYYDGDCGFCRKSVLLLKTFFLLPETRVQTAQEDASIFKDMQTRNSWVVMDWKGNQYFKYEAFLYLCRVSPLLWPLQGILGWKPIAKAGNWLYETVASNRQAAGLLTKYLSFHPLKVQSPRWADFLAISLLLIIFLWDLGELNPEIGKMFPKSLDWVGQVLGVNPRE